MPRDIAEHASADRRTALLHRMVMPDHPCPYGLKSKALLQRRGFEVEDRHLTSRAEVDAFMREHGVDTTPQTFIGGHRVGGYDELRVRFGLDDPDDEGPTYRPVVTIFAVSALMALAVSWAAHGDAMTVRAAEWFVAFAMVLLGLQKLQDVESFSLMFLNYDLLARRWVRYASIYPYAEAGAGLLMIAGALTWLAAPVAFIIGTIGAVSVVNAVYVDDRDLKCACVGGGSSVPLGFVSLTENLAMVGMTLWMAARRL